MDNITIDNFDGPLDLLLHLIKESKMDIFNIKLTIIIDKYLEYIQKMDHLNMDVASSYLVMASELLEIKSRKLLSKQNDEEDSEDELQNNLLDRLVNYQQYKDHLEYFRQLEEERSNYHTKIPSALKEYQNENSKIQLDNVKIDDLVEAFKNVLERIELEKPLNTKVTHKELSVDDVSINIYEIIRNKKQINFIELFDKNTREYVIVTFLAVLELASQKRIRIVQDNNFDNIICEVVDE